MTMTVLVSHSRGHLRMQRQGAVDSVGQRTGNDFAALPHVGHRVKDRPGAHSARQTYAEGRHENLNCKLCDECLNTSWFWNLFDARRKIPTSKNGMAERFVGFCRRDLLDRAQ